MVNERHKRGRSEIASAVLALPLMAGTVWSETSKARVLEAEPAIQAGPGLKARPPAKEATPEGTAKPVRAKKAVSKNVSGKPTTAAAELPKVPEIEGRRDPFKLPGPPVQGPGGEQPLGPLPPGARGLVIGQLRVEGIVRLDTTNTMIAVVDNNSNRAYFLRENDAVYNGVVAKITPDSVIFRENALDQNGKLIVREVVKRLGQGPGA